MPVVTPHVSGIIVEATVCKIIPSLITFLNHVNDHIMTWCNDYVAFVQHSEILKCRRNTNLHTEHNNGE